MNSLQFPYPVTPLNVPPSVTEPSAAFKKQVGRVMGAIILFLIVYLLMLLLSLVLVAACVYAGLSVIASLRGLGAILGGIGLIGLGVMVLFFLVKFLFAVTKFDESGSVEITEEEQPELFAFVKQVAEDTQVPLPKKILLSADVNAAVFYNSNFWSMFFPVRKNLLIGLGLVNTLNLSEFKAVVAHEFGHFSQRSMKLGSFVYNVNKIIYNMLYENSGYASAIDGWAKIHGIFAIFAGITVFIARGIQWVLRQMYAVINKSYMGLSREMEFHADAVAASVSGSNNLVTALRRVELGQLSYSTVIEKCNDLFREKKYSGDIFQNQRVILKQISADYKLTEQNGLPIVTNEFIEQNNTSRLNVKNQWASHPALEDREKHLNGLAVVAETLDDSAWVLFRNKEQWRERLTKVIYRNVGINDEMKMIDNREFESWFSKGVTDYSLPDEYKGYYDGRMFHVPTVEEENALLSRHTTTKSFDEIFSATHAGLHKQIQSAAGDIQLLKAIAANQYPVKTFDFDNVKYDKSEAGAVGERVEEEIKQWTALLQQTDLDSVRYFITHSPEEKRLADLYHGYFSLRRKADAYLKLINSMLSSLAPVFSGEVFGLEEAEAMVRKLKNEYEPGFKKELEQWMDAGAFDHEPAVKESVQRFTASNYAYFGANSFFETELSELDAIARNSWNAISGLLFNKFKHILKLQLAVREKQVA